MALLPAEGLEILDTWDALGLRGTASHDVRVPNLTCPPEHTLFLAGDDPAAAAVRYRIAQAGLLIGAVNVGLAQGALDDVVAVAEGGKRPAFSRRRLAESPLFQDRLGEAQVTCAAARALLYHQAGSTEQGATARATLRATVAKVAALTTGVVDTAHALAGGSSVYRDSPLQRRLRDMHTASQHFVNGREHYGMLGALMAGAEVDPALT
jgi:alkylation response protein AidB-like acyl-CoA dehydrogenase